MDTSPTSTRTRAMVEFHSHDRVLRVDGRHPEVARVVSCITDKSFGPPAGSFSLSLKRTIGKDPDFHSLFDEGEDIWMRIKWVKNGRTYDGTWGLSDTIHINTKREGDGKRVETINVSGFDFGKVFEKTSLFINIYEQFGILPIAPLYTAVQERLIGRPDQIVRTLIDSWLGNNGAGEKQWLLPPSIFGQSSTRRYFWDWLNMSTISSNLRGQMFAPTLLSAEGTRNLWDSMQEYSNPVLNEMWCDLAPDPDAGAIGPLDQLRPSLIMRERPFPTRVSRERWDALRTWYVRPKDIAERDVVSDGTGRFNYWSLFCAGSGASNFSLSALIQSQTGGARPGQPGNVPIFDIDSIRKHGLRRFEQQTRFLPIADQSDDARSGTEAGLAGNTADYWLRVAVQWLRMVHDWYVIVPKQFTGKIVTSSLMPWIRIGDRLVETRRGGEQWEYYIEHVTQSYQYGADGKTELHVTRGQPVGADFLVPQYQRYDGVDVSTLSDADITDTSATAHDAVGTPDADIGASSATSTSSEGAIDAAHVATDDAPAQSGAQVSEPSAAEDRDIVDADFEPGSVQVGGIENPSSVTSEFGDITVTHPGSEGAPTTPTLGPRGARRR